MIIEKSQAEKLYEAHCKFYQQAPVKWEVLATVTKTYWTFMAGDGDLELRQGKVVALSDYRPIGNKTIRRMHEHVVEVGKNLDDGWEVAGGVYITRTLKGEDYCVQYSYAEKHTALGLLEQAKLLLLEE